MCSKLASLNVCSNVKLSKVSHKLDSIVEKEIRRDDEENQKLASRFQALRDKLDEAKSSRLTDNAAEHWFNKLEETCYDIEDALDELNTPIRGQPTHKEAARKVRSSIPWYVLSCRRQCLRRDIDSKLKILSQKLELIPVDTVGLNVNSVSGSGDIKEEARQLHGRDQAKNRILEILLSESSTNLPIVRIVGMKGIGKTTLAREVFNENDVSTHFEKRIWVCASYPSDDVKVIKAILESLRDGPSDLVQMEAVLKQISQYVQSKKFLLVLDDVRSEYSKYWKQLMYSLKSGSKGSRILVTTQLENVADKMGSPNQKISLGRLCWEGSWSLFREVAFRNYDENKELEAIGRKIVDKCKGLPFGVKIIGSLLHFKETPGEWESILGSKIWELELVENELFLPLFISYYDLPSTLKKCFLYCSIFPKNYEIKKDRLIKLWMAQGYLKATKEDDMELIGEKYFKSLIVRSFFQDFQRNKLDGGIISCKMHNIVHDFVQILTKGKCSTVEVNVSEGGQLESYEKIKHLMINFERESTFPNSVYKIKKLRSLVVEPGGGFMTGIVLCELFDKLTCLRTLDLNNQDNVCYEVIRKVPREIKKLIHLRYLNLSKNSKIKRLPESLCELYNLETLELSQCVNLKKLPQGMGKLINLRHLVNDRTSLSYMPKGIERLICLRTLSEFIASGGSDDGKACKLGHLKNLEYLRGSLGIKKLGNVNNDDIKNAELAKLEKLLSLYLSFKKDEENWRTKREDDVLEDLQLPPNLERLEISYYRGKTISLIRIMSLTKLKVLTLDRCMHLEQLPRLAALLSLESLIVRKMRRVEKVGNEFLGMDQSSSTGKGFVAFPKLISLEFQKMKIWKEWSVSKKEGTDIKMMPCLRSLTIGYCPKLEALPEDYLPQTLGNLTVISCPKLKERYEEGTAERQKISHIKLNFS